jgi:hypothetical protein
MRISPLPADLQYLRDHDPRLLDDSRLGPADLHPVEEEMLDLGLDPEKVESEVYLEARAMWQAGRLPLSRLRAKARRLQAVREANRKTILDDLSKRSLG